jgi:DNA mismatch repair protein MutS2
MDDLFKLVQIENSKRKKVSVKQKQIQKAKEKKVVNEAEKTVEVIRQKKKVAKQKIEAAPQPKPNFKVGDRVRLQDGKAVGTIDKLEKNKAVINYGMFTTNVSVEQLELVESVK